MSNIFISHAHEDTASAERVREYLTELDHSVFLDVDVRRGLAAGSDWEQELYRHLRRCRALVVLCSHRSMESKWCFLEIAYVRALGKPVFPLKVDDCTVDAVLADTQITDLTADWQGGLERLRRGLLKQGLDPRELFDWPPPGETGVHGRPSPYPGMYSFEKEHAAVFFGRDEEIQDVRERLTRVRDYGASVVLVLGASGTGKSSLVRAGVLPRLRRQSDRWLVLEPVRCPPTDPVGELARAFEGAFAELGATPPVADVAAELRAAVTERAAATGDGSSNPLLDLATALHRHRGRQSVSVLLTVDQFEELLQQGELLEREERETTGRTVDDDAHASAFLRLLRETVEAPDSPVVLLATLREDFLPAFNHHAELRGMVHEEDLTLAEISGAEIRRVIEGPAELAGIELEPKLVNQLHAEAGDGKSLPLLAFVLRELDDECGADFKLAFDEYRNSPNLGSLERSVGGTADQIVRSALPGLGYQPEQRQQGPEVEARLTDLKTAFLRLVQLVRHNRFDGESTFARRTVRWRDLPAAAHPLLERFVAKRLLLVGGDEEDGATLEVAHEALFRSWPLLAGWLEDNAEALELAQQVREEAEKWQEALDDEEQDATDFYLRGSRLERVRELLTRDELSLEEREDRFVKASQKAARAGARRDRLIAASLVVALLLAVVGLVWALNSQARQIELERDAIIAEGDKLAAERTALQAREEQVAAQERAVAIQGYFETVFVPVEPARRAYSHTDLRSLLEDAEERLEDGELREKLSRYGDFQAEIRDRLAAAFVALGDRDRARGLYEKAVEGFEATFAAAEREEERRRSADRLISALLALTLVLPEGGELPTDRAAWEPRLTVGRRALEVAESVYPADHPQVVRAQGELAADLMRVRDETGRPLLMESLGRAMEPRRGGAEVELLFVSLEARLREMIREDEAAGRRYATLDPDRQDRYVLLLREVIAATLGETAHEPDGRLLWTLPTALEALAEHYDLRQNEPAIANHLYRCAEWFALNTYEPERNILTLIIQQRRARFLERHGRTAAAADLAERMRAARAAYLQQVSPFERDVIAELAWVDTATAESEPEIPSPAPAGATELPALYQPVKADFRSYYDQDVENHPLQPFDSTSPGPDAVPYWTWIERFYDGYFLLQGWNTLAPELVATFDDPAERLRARELVDELGRSIAREWAKDNDVRNIDSIQLAGWQGRILSAAKEADGGQELLRELEALLDEVRSLQFSAVEPQHAALAGEGSR